MAAVKTEITTEHYHISEANTYIISGTWPAGAKAEVFWNGEDSKTDAVFYQNFLRSSAAEEAETGLRSVSVQIQLPEELANNGTVEVYAVTDEERFCWWSITGRKLHDRQHAPQFNIEQVLRESSGCKIHGWCAAKSHVVIEVIAADGSILEHAQKRYARPDVRAAYPEAEIDADSGFILTLHKLTGRSVHLRFTCEEGTADYTVYLDVLRLTAGRLRILTKKTQDFVKTNGIAALPKKIGSKLRGGQARPVNYSEWRRYNIPTETILENQRETAFEYRPLISIVVPLYKTPAKYLDKLVRSVTGQTYSNWELVLSDGSGAGSPLAAALAKLEKEDARIRVLPADEPLRIVPNTNRAIEAAKGEFIAFADHDDELTPDALFECVSALNREPELDILYTDEDKTDESSNAFFEPNMKPEFNIDLLRTVNYICHLFVVRRTVLNQAGYLRAEYEGAQDYDLVLRCTEISDRIRRIPKVLYHWRAHSASTSENPESKRYAFDAGRRAVQAHYERVGIHAVVEDGEYPGLYRTTYIRDNDPLVSIIIPNKDHIADLKKCMNAIFTRSTYRNFEFVIIENNSELPETFEHYKELEAAHENVHVVYYEGGFNYSRINNFGEQYANGEYLLLLNNDIELISDDFLEQMLGYCMRPDVGAVGARLYYEDDTIQHAGVVIGFGGIAGHCFVMQPRWSTGYQHRIICAQDYSAVTAACMLVDRKVFREVGGLTEELAVAFNDIDFCMKVREKGYLIVYNPYAILYHYESKSRGLEDTPEKQARFAREIGIFRERWPKILEEGDPYYNPNLTLESQDFSLKRNF